MAPKDKHATLREFRQELTREGLLHDGDSIGTDDETLTRFLRARNFNIKNAALMWKNCQHWRSTLENVGIDELYRQIDPFDYPERNHVFECWPLYFHKIDKQGHPLNFHHFGGINLDKLQKKMTLEHFWQTMIVNAEALPREVLPAASEAAGRPITGTFVITDLAGFGISQFWEMKDFSRRSFQMSQDYFPDTMARLAIINAPRGFTAIWNVMKPWIAKETAAKITIMGSDYRSKLLELIDEDALPERLGGKCTCDGLGGCMMSNAGPWMHERQKRRDAWLKGERKTIAIMPGELSGKQQKAVVQEAEPNEESVGSAEMRTGLPTSNSTSTSDTSSVETSSMPSTPSLSEQDPENGPEPRSAKTSVDVKVRDAYEHHPETRQVQTGDLHKEIPVVAAL